MKTIYDTPIKISHNTHPVRSSYKFFENYNFKCLMNELNVNDKENITSGNKTTGRKMNSPMSQYKYIYKIINTSTVLKQSPCSRRKPLPHKLSSIVSLDCIENLNSKFDSAENMNLNLNCRNVNFTKFIDHMKEDSTYASYFENNDSCFETKVLIETKQSTCLAKEGKKQVYSNMVSKLTNLLN